MKNRQIDLSKQFFYLIIYQSLFHLQFDNLLIEHVPKKTARMKTFIKLQRHSSHLVSHATHEIHTRWIKYAQMGEDTLFPCIK